MISTAVILRKLCAGYISLELGVKQRSLVATSTSMNKFRWLLTLWENGTMRKRKEICYKKLGNTHLSFLKKLRKRSTWIVINQNILVHQAMALLRERLNSWKDKILKRRRGKRRKEKDSLALNKKWRKYLKTMKN